MIPTANAAYANATVICSDGNNQRPYQIGWDNSNIFFADKGYIPRFFCEGGYASPYRFYISDSLNNSALGYFNGVVPTPSSPTPSEPSPSPSPTETATVSPEPTPSESATPSPSPSSTPEPEPSPSATPEPSPSASSEPETQTSQVETQTVTPTQTDSSTTPSVSPVDGSTATSQPQPQPEPTPPVPPVVEPDPVEEPAVVPEEEPIPDTPEEVVQEEAPEPITEPIVDEVEESPQVETTVTLDNGVVLTQEQAVAVALLQNPGELLQELFTNPGAALAALGQVGADMSPEVREKSEKVVISAVIAGNIATQAAATAGAVAAYRRKQ